MTRGEVWWVDFGVPYGSERGFVRPVVIVQNDTFNKSRINTTVVVLLTTNLDLAELSCNLYLAASDTQLQKDSCALTPQLGVIDKTRLLERVSRLSPSVMQKLSQCIMDFLALPAV